MWATPTAESLELEHRGKRVRNGRLSRELGYALRWPTYREGLRRTYAIEHAHGLVVPAAQPEGGSAGGTTGEVK